MFDFLKKKISAFTDKIKQTLEKKPEEKIPEAIKTEEIQKTEIEKTIYPEPELEKEEISKPVLEEIEPEIPKQVEEAVFEKPLEKKEVVKKIDEPLAEKEVLKVQPNIEPKKTGILERIFKPKIEPKKEIVVPKKEIPKPEVKKTSTILEKKIEKPVEKIPAVVEESIEEKVEGISEEVKKLKEDKRELKAKQGLGKQLTGLIFGKVKIEEKDISEFLDEFELSLLEGDVEQDTALQIILELKKEMIGKEVKKSEDLGEFLKKEIKNAMAKVMETEEVNLLEKIQGKKPFIIMMLGPNGAGKTTSIAKLTYMFQQNKKKVVLASADTFRAGSIEQIETHAERLGARVVKHKYGADPAAVAFDAVKAAESEKADVVLIDTAGRQETNKNLMEELKKIKRVVKPDFTIFVGESLAGQSFLSQAEKFSSELGIDGFILTKIDTDAKGGTAISLLYKIKKPILYVGTGQDYKDLEKFTPEFVLDRII